MKFKYIVLVFFLISLLAGFSFMSCTKDDDEPEPPTITISNFITIAYEDSIRIEWNSPEADDDGFQGFYLYVSNIDLNEISTGEYEDYCVWDTPQADTTYLLDEYAGELLDMNAKYYFAVRAELSTEDGDTFSPFYIVDTSPVILGGGTIYEFASDSVCAIAFETGETMTKYETTEPDMFLVDYPEGSFGLAIKSPHLAGIPTSWMVETQFKTLGTGTLNDFHQTTTTGFTNQEDVTAKVYAIRSGTNYVKLIITGFMGEYPERYITFNYKYQNKPNYPHF